jgi:hypothetical protein
MSSASPRGEVSSAAARGPSGGERGGQDVHAPDQVRCSHGRMVGVADHASGDVDQTAATASSAPPRQARRPQQRLCPASRS